MIMLFFFNLFLYLRTHYLRAPRKTNPTFLVKCVKSVTDFYNCSLKVPLGSLVLSDGLILVQIVVEPIDDARNE